MKKFLYIIIALLSFTLVGCSKEKEDNSLKKVIDSGKIVIATSPDYPPFEFIDSRKSGQDQYVGADIELMKYIAKELGVELVIEAVSFDTVLSLTQDGTVDLAISGITYSEEREDNYIFSYYYNDEGNQGVLALKSKYQATTSFDEFKNKLVGAQNGTLQAGFVTEQISQNSLQKFDKIADGIMQLDNNLVEGVALAEKVAKMIMEQNPNKYVFLDQKFVVDPQETRTYALLPKGSNALNDKINEIIEKVVDQDLYLGWDNAAKELAIELGQMG